MNRRFIRRSWVAAVLCAAAAAVAFPPAKPYDPRPLMEQVAKKTTADKYTFLVFGDSKMGGGLDGVLVQAEKLSPSFVMLTGDMVEIGDRPGDYDKFEKQMGEFMRKVPTWPCFGNHEAKKRGYANYVRFYGMEKVYYSFDFRNGRFIVLEAQEGPELMGKQAEWFEKQLAEGRKAGKHLFVLQHAPCWTIGAKDRMHIPNKPSAVSRLCEKYGVTADFSGHEHLYYRTNRGGVTYITQGAGGAGVYPLRREGEAVAGDVYFGGIPKEGSQYGSTSWKLHTPAGEKPYDKPHYMLTAIEVDGAKVTGKTILAGGEVIDTFTLAGGKDSAPKAAAGDATSAAAPASDRAGPTTRPAAKAARE